jgi:hypothetical protein
MRKFRKLLGLALVVSCLGFGASGAWAQTWVGTADYTGVGGTKVGPFDTYDFAPGPLLMKDVLGAGPGDTVTGYYQAYVAVHALNGVGVEAPGLDINGSDPPGEYEVTLAATFDSLILPGSTPTSAVFQIVSGSARMFLDGDPNYDFAADSGFTDGTEVFNGDINGVGGTFSLFLPDFGIGASAIRAVANSVGGIYDPASIVGASATFTLQFRPEDQDFLAPITSVLGQQADPAKDLLLVADGNTNFVVPIPPSLLLLVSGLAGAIVIGRRRKRD